MLFDELAELAGQRNAIDARIVEIVAEIGRDGLWSNTGCRSVAALVAWKLGASTTNAHTITAVAEPGRRSSPAAFKACGRVGCRWIRSASSLSGPSDGSDEHYAALADVATVSQLRTAIKLEPRPDPDPHPEPQRSISKTSDGQCTTWRITLPKLDAAKFDAALGSHQDALIADWKRDHDDDGGDGATPTLCGRRCPTPLMRSWRWWRPAGTPMRLAARTGSTPRWWCTSMSKTGSLACIWVRCSPSQSADT